MNVSRYSGADSVKPSRTNSPDSPSPDTSFEASSGLTKALAAVPDVRPEAVSRAKALIADPSYPSDQTIKQLSGFLARQLTASQSE